MALVLGTGGIGKHVTRHQSGVHRGPPATGAMDVLATSMKLTATHLHESNAGVLATNKEA